jgi:hypothetical protein
MSGYVYLASPYSDPDPVVREYRYKAACDAAAYLMRRAFRVFSPIAHSHPIEVASGSVEPGEFWKNQDLPLLRHADIVIVLMLDGWRESAGIKWEVETAASLGMEIRYLDTQNFELRPTPERTHPWTMPGVSALLIPKRGHIRSRKLLDAAEGEACVSCGMKDGTVVAAHSNMGSDGKGGGIKAEDIYIAFLCHKCHSDYDQPRKWDSDLDRNDWFNSAMKRTWKRLFEKGVLRIA